MYSWAESPTYYSLYVRGAIVVRVVWKNASGSYLYWFVSCFEQLSSNTTNAEKLMVQKIAPYYMLLVKYILYRTYNT